MNYAVFVRFVTVAPVASFVTEQITYNIANPRCHPECCVAMEHRRKTKSITALVQNQKTNTARLCTLLGGKVGLFKKVRRTRARGETV
jgi:hypothetical protein